MEMAMRFKEMICDSIDNPKDYCFSHSEYVMSNIYCNRLKQNADLTSQNVGCKSSIWNPRSVKTLPTPLKMSCPFQ